MNRWFVRHLYAPLTQALQGERMSRFLPALEETQWLPPEEHERRAWLRLRDLLPRIGRTVPYLQRRWAGIDLERIVDRDALQRLPLLTKAEVRAHADELETPAYSGGRVTTQTSGSTGLPLRLVHSHDFRSRHEASQWRARRWYGVDVGDPTAVMWGCPVHDAFGRWVLALKYRLNNILPLSAFELDAEAVRAGWGRLRRFRPSFVYAYPSALAAFAREVRRQGLSPLSSPPRVVMTSCEMLLEAQRREIHLAFDAPVANVYGCAEFGSFVHECPRGGLHISAENVLVEVLKEGRPVLGESGEIVVTSLYNEAMPFVRYAVGDVGRLLDEPCPCGRGLPRLSVDLGRTVDIIRTSQGRVFSAAVFDYIDKRLVAVGHQVESFRVVQQAADDFEVLVVPGDCNLEKVAAVFHDVIREEIGEVSLRVRMVDEIPRDRSGKLRYFESRVGEAGDGHG